MYCSQCGVENSDQAIQCVNCGGSLIAAGQPQPDGLDQPQTCGLAVAALVMGILSIFCNFIMAIPAIICGIIALTKISKSRGKLVGNGYAIAGITVPVLVMVLITPLLLAIMLPALSQARHMAQLAVCSSNLHELSVAMTVYVDDNNKEYPIPEQWCDLLMQEAGVSMQSMRCPCADEGTFSYAMNENLRGLNARRMNYSLPGNIVALFEADLGKNGVGGREDVVLRHDHAGQAGCNIVFADGRIEFVAEDRLDDLIWTVE